MCSTLALDRRFTDRPVERARAGSRSRRGRVTSRILRSGPRVVRWSDQRSRDHRHELTRSSPELGKCRSCSPAWSLPGRDHAHASGQSSPWSAPIRSRAWPTIMARRDPAILERCGRPWKPLPPAWGERRHRAPLTGRRATRGSSSSGVRPGLGTIGDRDLDAPGADLVTVSGSDSPTTRRSRRPRAERSCSRMVTVRGSTSGSPLRDMERLLGSSFDGRPRWCGAGRHIPPGRAPVPRSTCHPWINRQGRLPGQGRAGFRGCARCRKRDTASTNGWRWRADPPGGTVARTRGRARTQVP